MISLISSLLSPSATKRRILISNSVRENFSANLFMLAWLGRRFRKTRALKREMSQVGRRWDFAGVGLRIILINSARSVSFKI